ncbi:hypothetical protein [Marispirochaeta sp.]|uniref:hypothetical protein n=1 Tax=Marispirochaeta sp. TaxID=2038653 RepID=UPI0029C6BD87|nr:hypothetical protein [Marispirochaeta sp.]
MNGVKLEPVPAELEGSSCFPGTVTGTLSSECPYCYCGRLDGYVSTGEHAVHGRDQARCSGCGRGFLIQWLKRNPWRRSTRGG